MEKSNGIWIFDLEILERLWNIWMSMGMKDFEENFTEQKKSRNVREKHLKGKYRRSSSGSKVRRDNYDRDA